MDINEKGRIIGDFLEINGDMVYQREMSKLPKFISRIIFKNNHRKLTSRLIKFKNSGYILTKDNLLELFSYVYNNFPPKGNYKSIVSSTIDSINGIVSARMEIDNLRCDFTIDEDSELFDIEIIVYDNAGNTKTSNTRIASLHSNNKKLEDNIYKINKQLVEDMGDYILDILSSYVD